MLSGESLSGHLPLVTPFLSAYMVPSSPQFRSAVSSFDQALRTGLLGGLVRGLGLPDEAGTGITPFLRAVQEQADRERGGASEDSMETD